MMITRKLMSFSLLLIFDSPAFASDYNEMNLDELGNVDVYSSSILDSHIHYENDLMFAYSYKRSYMSGLGSKSNETVTPERVLQDYPVTPLNMDMIMHMFHIMYAMSDDTTFMVMLPYMSMKMEHKTRMGGRFTTESEGVGDVEISINNIIKRGDYQGNSYRWFIHQALSLPTGDIDSRDITPMGDSQLPYAMQLGSGSYQYEIALGGDIAFNDHSYGQLLSFAMPLDKNDAGYKRGTEIIWKAWRQHAINEKWSLDIGIKYQWLDDISGEDARINSNLVPTADFNNYGGQIFNLNTGLSYQFENNQKVVTKIFVPLWQDLNGFQLRKQWALSLSWEVLL